MINEIHALNVGSFTSIGSIYYRPHQTFEIELKPRYVCQVVGSGNFVLEMNGTWNINQDDDPHDLVPLHVVSSFGIYSFDKMHPTVMEFHCTSLQAGGSIQILCV